MKKQGHRDPLLQLYSYNGVGLVQKEDVSAPASPNEKIQLQEK
jgi:hypothetical protein